jgi:hypothetical protein
VRDVTIEVSPKRPKRFQQVKIAGNLGLEEKRKFLFFHYRRDPEKQIRRWLRRDGVKEHERVVAESVKKARERVLDKLEGKGFVEAHVNVVYSPDQTGLTVLVDAGPKLEVWWTHGERQRRAGRGGAPPGTSSAIIKVVEIDRERPRRVANGRGRARNVASCQVSSMRRSTSTRDSEASARSAVGVPTGPKLAPPASGIRVIAPTFGEKWIAGGQAGRARTIDRRDRDARRRRGSAGGGAQPGASSPRKSAQAARVRKRGSGRTCSTASRPPSRGDRGSQTSLDDLTSGGNTAARHHRAGRTTSGSPVGKLESDSDRRRTGSRDLHSALRTDSRRDRRRPHR